MGARTFRELEVWQLAYALKLEVYRLTASGPVTRDFRFRSQIRESAASACALISEGFGRFRPAEFAKKVNDARGEIDETDNHLEDGVDRGYFTAADIKQATSLVKRARAASARLLQYLQRIHYKDVANLRNRKTNQRDLEHGRDGELENQNPRTRTES